MIERGWKSKVNKLIKDLLLEYSLNIDDIRWLLSVRLTEKILSLRETPLDLTRLIWSGKLESDLYNMEESLISEIESELDRDIIDEVWVREQFAEASELKCRRPE